jgi:hypothetical protein
LGCSHGQTEHRRECGGHSLENQSLCVGLLSHGHLATLQVRLSPCSLFFVVFLLFFCYSYYHLCVSFSLFLFLLLLLNNNDSDGTDINAVDVCEEKGLAVSANDDAGLVRLFNYPCIVKNAPAKDYGGHSSHVTNIKFIKGGDSLVTAGGNDGSAMIFSVVREENNPFPAFK